MILITLIPMHQAFILLGLPISLISLLFSGLSAFFDKLSELNMLWAEFHSMTEEVSSLCWEQIKANKEQADV